MHWQAITPLLTSLTMTGVVMVWARHHHRAPGDADIFTFSPAVACLMIGIGILLCIVPFLPGASRGIPTILFFFYLSPFWLYAFTLSAWLLRYQVVVTDSSLAYGSFRRRVVSFSDVIDLDVLTGRKSSELWVYLKTGKKLKFSGLLNDFDALVGMVNSHMAGLPGPQRDSPAKMLDQKKRKQDDRTLDWFLIVGTVIVGVFVFVLWRMQLLHK